MTDLKDLRLQPFNLRYVPSGMEWCVYPEERKRGEVFCPETIYRVVLALRWLLTYTDHGLEEEFETWKVYWKNDDEYGFKTHIFLFQEKVEQYDSLSDGYEVLQQQTLYKLATLQCRNGQGVITDVHMPIGHPFEGMKHLNGAMGVQRLLENAALASNATHSISPLCHNADRMSVLRISGEYSNTNLAFKVESNGYWVSSVELETWEQPFRW